MEKYPSIKTVYLRDPENKYRTLLEGQWALPEFEYLADNRWVFTEKVDGTNIRVIWETAGPPVLGHLSFKGRTDNAQFPTFLYDRLGELFSVDRFWELYSDVPMTLYGEGYGARIQKGGGNYIPDGVDFILFDVKVGDCWLERHNVEDIADELGIRVVPTINQGALGSAVEIARQGFLSQVAANKEFVAEGLVMRPKVELADRRGHRIIAKIKHKDFGGQE